MHENRMEQNNSPTPLQVTQPTANYVNCDPRTKPQNQGVCGGFRTRGNRGCGGNRSGPPVFCQLCQKPYHSVL